LCPSTDAETAFVSPDDDERDLRDGVPPDAAHGSKETPQSVNIFPHDNHSAINDIFYFTEDEDLDDAQLAYDWTLYLSDTLPISGKLTISKAVVGERV